MRVQAQCALVTPVFKVNVLIQSNRSLKVWVSAGIFLPTAVAGLMSPLVIVPELGLEFLRLPLASFPMTAFGFPQGLNPSAGGGSL